MPRYVYRAGPDGKVLGIPVTGLSVRDDREVPFEEQMFKNLYRLECRDGSRFRVRDFTKNQLKKIWSLPDPPESQHE